MAYCSEPHAAPPTPLAGLQGALGRPDLWQELQLLDKLLYKNSNQHRSAQHYQRLQEVPPPLPAALLPKFLRAALQPPMPSLALLM